MGFGKNVRNIRKAIGMTQEELAQALGYTNRSTISKIEAERGNPSVPQVKEFARVLHCKVSDLLEETTFEKRTSEIYSLIPLLQEADDNTFEIIKRILNYSN